MSTPMTLSAAHGDIAQLQCDLLVVSANTLLDFEGRAAAALRPLCGDEAERVFAPLRGGVRVGDVIVTPAGTHPAAVRVLWAVVRDYARGDIDEAAALAHTAPRIWQTATSLGIPPRFRSLCIGVVPLNAADIGLQTSVKLLRESLLRFVSSVPLSVMVFSPVEAEARAIYRLTGGGYSSKAGCEVRTRPSAPAAPAPASARTLASYQKTSSPRVRVERLSHCQGAPVGCAGLLIRVRKGDEPVGLRIVSEPAHACNALTFDGVPLESGDTVQVRPGPHVIAFVASGDLARLSVAARRSLEGGRFVWDAQPPDGWRGLGFDDEGWSPAISHTRLIEAPAGAACRVTFTLDTDGNPA